jgi:hypothetical protein
MAAFDRDDVTGNAQFRNDLRPDRGFPASVRSNAPAWIAGIVIVVALIGAFAYESGNSGTQSVTTPPTHEMTQPPPVNPAPPPDSPKP